MPGQALLGHPTGKEGITAESQRQATGLVPALGPPCHEGWMVRMPSPWVPPEEPSPRSLLASLWGHDGKLAGTGLSRSHHIPPGKPLPFSWPVSPAVKRELD